MSSYTASLNRKVTGGYGDLEESAPIQDLGGTPVQQCYQILNFHETRINKITGFLTNGLVDQRRVENNRISMLEREIVEMRATIAAMKRS
jgi:hypothetical protein